jgi:pimeloyl-ACP methyl ester carboxylesterase
LPQAKVLPMHEEFVHWCGHRVHVTDEGEGEPLLLIAGLGSNSGMWGQFMEHVPGRRYIRFDAPGTGLSSTPLCPIPVAKLANLAAAVLDARGVAVADVIGYSYGGAISQQLAYEFQDRVRRLVLAATTCGIGAEPGTPSANIVLATPLRYYSPTYFERTAATVFGGATGRDPCVRQAMIASRRRQPPSYYGYAMQLLGAAGWSSLPYLDRIPHQTLVICGDDDPLVPIGNAALLADRIPNARLEIIEEAGHLFLWDDAENLGQRISRFIDGSGPKVVTH